MRELRSACIAAAARAWLGYVPVGLETNEGVAQAAKLEYRAFGAQRQASGREGGVRQGGDIGARYTASQKADIHAEVIQYLRFGPTCLQGRPSLAQVELPPSREHMGVQPREAEALLGRALVTSAKLLGTPMQSRSGQASLRDEAAHLLDTGPSGLR